VRGLFDIVDLNKTLRHRAPEALGRSLLSSLFRIAGRANQHVEYKWQKCRPPHRLRRRSGKEKLFPENRE
jgi:hypothetical protein